MLLLLLLHLLLPQLLLCSPLPFFVLVKHYVLATVLHDFAPGDASACTGRSIKCAAKRAEGASELPM